METKAKKMDAKAVKNFLSNNAIILLVIVLALGVGLKTNNFFTIKNVRNLIINMSPRFIIACGVSGCLITKGTDLSAGRQVGLAACLSAMLLQSVDYSARVLTGLPDIPVVAGLVIVLLIMACFGAINGCIIAFLKVPPFIATLGTQTIVYGICSVITNNQPLGGFKPSYSKVATGSIAVIPYLVIFAALVGVYMWFLYNAVAVDVALGLGVEDQLTLHGAALASVAANVNQLVVSSHLLSGGLTVDQNGGDVSILHSCDDGVSSGGHNGVHDQSVHTLSDEGVDLLGLLSLVVVAVHAGNGVALVFQDLGQGITIGGHESVVKLVDADTNGAAGRNALSNAGSCRRSSSGSGRSGSRSGRSGRSTASNHAQSHGACQNRCKQFFHDDFLLFDQMIISFCPLGTESLTHFAPVLYN